MTLLLLQTILRFKSDISTPISTRAFFARWAGLGGVWLLACRRGLPGVRLWLRLRCSVGWARQFLSAPAGSHFDLELPGVGRFSAMWRYYMPQADLSRSFRSCLEAIHSL